MLIVVMGDCTLFEQLDMGQGIRGAFGRLGGEELQVKQLADCSGDQTQRVWGVSE